MALTESNMIDLGTKAPFFNLPDTISDTDINVDSIKGTNATLVMFTCNHCPYVIHINDELVKLANDYAAKGVGFVAISSNDAVNYPQDGPEEMKQHAKECGYPFPYLYDENQEVAKAYDAACTPDFYLFDGDLILKYRGQLDGSRPGSGLPVTGKDLRVAIDLVLAKKELSPLQRPSAGCNIKWKK
jgi:peroxiredoxin